MGTAWPARLMPLPGRRCDRARPRLAGGRHVHRGCADVRMGDDVKQAVDTKTMEIEGLPKRRGRPPGDGKTSAQRQKERRERLRQLGIVALTVEVPADVAAALRKFVEFKDETQSEAVVRILRDRLLRKR